MPPLLAQITGRPGTGKTSRLLDIMSKVLKELHDPRLVGFTSLTRAARSEASTRAAEQFGMKLVELERDGWFKTLHAIAFKCLGIKQDDLLAGKKADREWLQEVLQEGVNSEAKSIEHDYGGEGWTTEASEADKALSIWDVARNRLVPFAVVHGEVSQTYDSTPPLDFCRSLATRYETAKRVHHRFDFTDLLTKFGGQWCDLDGAEACNYDGEEPDLPVWFFDEAQDFSALDRSVMERLMSSPSCKWVYVAGDDRQCQPRGTPVLTVNGYKPIEEIQQSDGLIARDVDGRKFMGFAKSVKFRKSSRWVDSAAIFRITMEDGTVHDATENHRWWCRTERDRRYAVYLMQRGTRWRVGTVQMWGYSGRDRSPGFRLNMRCNQERADRCWVLKICDSDRDARAYEQIVAAQCGLPQVTFMPPTGVKTNLDAGFIEAVFLALGDLTAKGLQCIKRHGLCSEFPYWARGLGGRNGDAQSRKQYTCNLLAGITFLPKINPNDWDVFRKGSRKGRVNGISRKNENRLKQRRASIPEWIRIVSIKRLPAGVPTEVWSLDVEKYHTYVTKDYYTCNCIFGFRGADPSIFRNLPYTKRDMLPVSYRCPAPVWELAEQVIRETSDFEPDSVQPAPHPGSVEVADSSALVDIIKPTEDWLVLARTNFLAGQLSKALDAAGVPWVATRGGSHWNAPVRNAAVQALSNAQHGAPLDGSEWRAVCKLLPSKISEGELLIRGTKVKFEAMDDAQDQYPWVMLPDLPILGATELLCQVISSGRWPSLLEGADRYLDAVARWGEEVVEKLKVRISTIHGAKGMEADNVALLTTLSSPCYRGAQTTKGRDAEGRLFYVGVTRAKRRLVILNERRPRFRKKMPCD